MKPDFKNKTYTLRNKLKYRNYHNKGGGHYPIHGAYEDDDDGVWNSIQHTAHGHFKNDQIEDEFDLIEVNAKIHTITFWMNYYSNGVFTYFGSRQAADLGTVSNRIACLEITHTFVEGEGLEGGE